MSTQKHTKYYINIFVLLLLIVAFVTLESCCKKNDEPKKCNEGFVLVNGECQCPPGQFDYKGICLNKSQGNYFLDSTDCACIKKPHNFLLTFPVEELSRKDSYVDFSLTYNYKGGGSTSSTFFPYQDSFYCGLFTHGYEWDCYKKTFAYGIFTENKSKLKIRVFGYDVDDYFGNRENAIDSCTLWMSNRY